MSGSTLFGLFDIPQSHAVMAIAEALANHIRAIAHDQYDFVNDARQRL
jgi:hypothetical protein